MTASPDNLEAQEGLAWAALESHDFARAQQLCQALETNPTHRAFAILGRARASRGLGDVAAARTQYETFLREFPKSKEARAAKAELKALRGDARPAADVTSMTKEPLEQAPPVSLETEKPIETEKPLGLPLDPDL